MSSRLTTGSIFAHRYRIERCLAQGGMGEVYEVVHLETERRRALKVMHVHVLQNDDGTDLRERFMREAKVAAHIESEFIVDVFDAGVDEAAGQPFLVMELLRGEELGKRVKRLGHLSLSEAAIYLHQTALALDKTHKASIVHRDIKPGNLFVTEREDGQPWIKVLDFGIAKLVAESTVGAATQAFGTPLYMAPEQFDSRARITPAADIYALGMVAYSLLTGRAYWAAEGKAAGVFALAAVAALGPKEPASVRAAARGITLPPGFDAWFAKITAVDPSQRFPSAIEAVRALGVAPPMASGIVASTLQVPPESTRLPTAEEPPAITGATMRPASFPTISRAPEPAPRDRKKAILGAVIALGAGIAIGLASNARRSDGEPIREAGPAAIGSSPLASASARDALAAPNASAAAEPTLSAAASLSGSVVSAAPSASSPSAAVKAQPQAPRIPPPRKYTRD